VSTKRVRYERIIWALRITTRVTLVAALAGTFIPGETGRRASAAAVGFVIAAPLLRVSWLAYRWWRWGDRVFASVAASLLLVVGTGTTIALLTR
jgi:O-antigen ligase